MKKNILKTGSFFIVLFLILILYLTYLVVVQGEQLQTNSGNIRLTLEEKKIIRGSILDAKGQILAQEVANEDGSTSRRYPMGQLTSVLTGYGSLQYGKSGLEADYDTYLLADDELGQLQKTIAGWKNETMYGYNLHLTVDSSFQQLVYDALGERRGAVVALEPRTGAVLALVSKPTYDADRIGEILEDGSSYFSQISSDTANSPLVNRAVWGQYPPGSTFKLITASSMLENLPEQRETIYNCQGSFWVDGFTLADTAIHQEVDWDRALQVSCNSFYSSIGLLLGEDNFRKTAQAFGFKDMQGNTQARTELSYLDYFKGVISNEPLTKTNLASSAIGQGSVLVSPMQMALVAAAVADDGKMMTPYLVKQITAEDGRVVLTTENRVMLDCINFSTAAELTQAMELVVTNGTGKLANLDSVRVAGKTGSAENSTGDTHAWFVGFAPADNPQIAVAVIVENGGGGGKIAAPIAAEIIGKYLALKAGSNP
ncbi:MAG: penicillin-binding protein 2 [Clostridia bacterium]|nr:penicillin-binding protein 2 [Clostridia bacterium]